MIKNHYEIKERILTEQILVKRELICDICKKEIQKGIGYWRVTTHHNDWGNDSVDSFEYFDVCSVECLKDKFNEYCYDSSRSNDNTWQIEVEHKVFD